MHIGHGPSFDDAGSEEFIIHKGDEESDIKPGANDVVVHTAYHVTSEENLSLAEQGANWGVGKGGGISKTVVYRGGV